MKKRSVNRHRNFKEQVPKSAKTASSVQGHYFDFHQDALGHTGLKRVHGKTKK